MLRIEVLLRESTDHIKAGLFPFVEGRMRDEYGAGWERRASCQFINGTPHWDLQALLKTMIEHWNVVFDKVLPRTTRNLVFELKDWRNHVAHEHQMTLEDTSRLLDTATRLLKVVGASQAREVGNLRLAVIQEELNRSDMARNDRLVPPRLEERTVRTSESESTVNLSSGRQNHVPGAPSWQSCVNRIAAKLVTELTQKSGRCAFSKDRDYGVCCLVSKEYPGNRFWWNLRERQIKSLASVPHSYIAFACGSEESIIVIPVKDFLVWLPTFNPKPGADGEGWHIHVLHENGAWYVLQTGRNNRVAITQYLI